MSYTHFSNGFKAISDRGSKILILGSHPSPDSITVGFYYSGSRNRFWPTISKVFDVEPLQNEVDKKAFCLKHGIALWDVIESCDREGAKDSTIRNVVYNDLEKFLKNSTITHVFCLGVTAYKFYCKYRESKNRTIPEAYYLVSSSNTARSTKKDPELIVHYKDAIKKVPGYEKL